MKKVVGFVNLQAAVCRHRLLKAPDSEGNFTKQSYQLSGKILQRQCKNLIEKSGFKLTGTTNKGKRGVLVVRVATEVRFQEMRPGARA